MNLSRGRFEEARKIGSTDQDHQDQELTKIYFAALNLYRHQLSAQALQTAICMPRLFVIRFLLTVFSRK